MPYTIGIDLTLDHIGAYVSGSEKAEIWPASLAYGKTDNKWYAGSEAYKKALTNDAVITDKLLRLLKMGGTHTINGKALSAVYLLSELFKTVFREITGESGFSADDRVCICIHEASAELLDGIKESAVLSGISPERLTVTTHEEAFIYYVLSLDKSFYTNTCMLFDMGKESLSCYEFSLLRGMKVPAAKCTGTDIPEAFRAGILSSESGKALGNRIITDAAKRFMEGKLVSSVFLTGDGFEDTDWAPDFLSYICQRRKVMLEKGLFAIGASLIAKAEEEGTEREEMVLCNSRLQAELSLSVRAAGRDVKLILLHKGERWHGLNVRAELMPYNGDFLDFTIEPAEPGAEKRVVRADLSSFPKRPPRTTRAEVSISPKDRGTLELTVKDLGFGDLFPAAGTEIHEEISLL